MYKFEKKNITALGFKTQDKYYQVLSDKSSAIADKTARRFATFQLTEI